MEASDKPMPSGLLQHDVRRVKTYAVVRIRFCLQHSLVMSKVKLILVCLEPQSP